MYGFLEKTIQVLRVFSKAVEPESEGNETLRPLLLMVHQVGRDGWFQGGRQGSSLPAASAAPRKPAAEAIAVIADLRQPSQVPSPEPALGPRAK